jgi:hypothetical protein
MENTKIEHIVLYCKMILIIVNKTRQIDIKCLEGETRLSHLTKKILGEIPKTKRWC